MNNQEFSRAVRSRQAKKRWQSENRGFIWLVRIFFVVTIALLLIGVFGNITANENIKTEEEYNAWNKAFNAFIVIGVVGLAMTVIVSLIFIRG